jgi:hypothetical protein
MKKEDSHAYKMSTDEFVFGRTIRGEEHAEAVKFSNIENASITNCVIIGGYEDCIDMVRGRNYQIFHCDLKSSAKTRTFITAKGGIENLIISKCTFWGPIKYPWDISLGDHTIYNKGKLMNMNKVLLRKLKRTDSNRKVRVLALDCNNITHDDTVTLIKVPKLLVKLLMKLKG